MATYRIYDLTAHGHLKEPPRVVSCQSDSDAIFAACARREADREIWQKDRRVALVNADEFCRMTAMASDINATIAATREIIDSSRDCLRDADRSLERR